MENTRILRSDIAQRIKADFDRSAEWGFYEEDSDEAHIAAANRWKSLFHVRDVRISANGEYAMVEMWWPNDLPWDKTDAWDGDQLWDMGFTDEHEGSHLLVVVMKVSEVPSISYDWRDDPCYKSNPFSRLYQKDESN